MLIKKDLMIINTYQKSAFIDKNNSIAYTLFSDSSTSGQRCGTLGRGRFEAHK
jgi:hypothetical protein